MTNEIYCIYTPIKTERGIFGTGTGRLFFVRSSFLPQEKKCRDHYINGVKYKEIKIMEPNGSGRKGFGIEEMANSYCGKDYNEDNSPLWQRINPWYVIAFSDEDSLIKHFISIIDSRMASDIAQCRDAGWFIKETKEKTNQGEK